MLLGDEPVGELLRDGTPLVLTRGIEYSRALTHAHTHTRARTNTRTCTHTHTQTHTHSHTRTRTRTRRPAGDTVWCHDSAPPADHDPASRRGRPDGGGADTGATTSGQDRATSGQDQATSGQDQPPPPDAVDGGGGACSLALPHVVWAEGRLGTSGNLRTLCNGRIAVACALHAFCRDLTLNGYAQLPAAASASPEAGNGSVEVVRAKAIAAVQSATRGS